MISIPYNRIDFTHIPSIQQAVQEFGSPRFFVRVAGLEMHPLDEENRLGLLKNELGLGYCNITKCCTEVCPEDIKITDNAIIPLPPQKNLWVVFC